MGNQETAHESTYKMKTMLELCNTKETPEGKFTISFKTIELYQQKFPSL